MKSQFHHPYDLSTLPIGGDAQPVSGRKALACYDCIPN
jgi:hypothetical protein